MNFIMISISILISMAFYTILERKILSYIQIRKGPNKVGMLGIFQPFSDAIKLFNKNLMTMEMINATLFYLSPMMALLISLLIIPMIPFNNLSLLDNKHNMLMFMVISSISVYIILMIGWSSNSKYSHLGSMRGVAQMISYEISLFLLILFLSILSNSYSLWEYMEIQFMNWFFWGNMILFSMWMVSALAEVNRSPFDFAEGESELVSGFNVEYMGGMFALIFLAEYLSMLMLSYMTTIMFFKTSSYCNITIMIIITIFFLWIRGTLPRFRYDKLMNLTWKIMLPMILLLIPITKSFQMMFL